MGVLYFGGLTVAVYLLVMSKSSDDEKKKSPFMETFLLSALIAFPVGGVLMWIFPDIQKVFG